MTWTFVTSKKYRHILYIQTSVLTSLRYSKHPETGYALVTNLATLCMLINPFQMVLRRERKREVSPSWGDRDSVMLQNKIGGEKKVRNDTFPSFFCLPPLLKYLGILNKWIDILRKFKHLIATQNPNKWQIDCIINYLNYAWKLTESWWKNARSYWK